MKKNLFLLVLLFSTVASSQTVDEQLAYYELPEYPETYTAGTMAARMVDALGFRYYWATEGLRENDLEYKPSDAVSSIGETVDHILGMSYVIFNATLKKPNDRNDVSKWDFEHKRTQTLINLKAAADMLRTSDDISQFKIIFGENEIPFWNNVNGPIADSIWHCGQIASFRRSSGNPINPKINHFMGTLRD